MLQNMIVTKMTETVAVMVMVRGKQRDSGGLLVSVIITIYPVTKCWRAHPHKNASSD